MHVTACVRVALAFARAPSALGSRVLATTDRHANSSGRRTPISSRHDKGHDMRCVTGAGVKMEHLQAVLDPRKQELLEARFLGARVSLSALTIRSRISAGKLRSRTVPSLPNIRPDVPPPPQPPAVIRIDFSPLALSTNSPKHDYSLARCSARQSAAHNGMALRNFALRNSSPLAPVAILSSFVAFTFGKNR